MTVRGAYAISHARWLLPVSLLLILALAVDASPVAAALHPGSSTVVTRDINVEQDGGIDSGLVSCPTGKRIVTGGAYFHLPGKGRDPTLEAYLSSSAPVTDGRSWFAAGVNWESVGLRLRIIARCVSKEVVGTYVVRTLDVPLAFHEAGGGTAACPAGHRIVTGGAFWHLPGKGRDKGLQAYLRSSAPTSDVDGWYASGWSDVGTSLVLQVVALCLRAASVGAYAVKRNDVRIKPDGGTGGDTVTCPSGKRVAAGGAFWHRTGQSVRATWVAYTEGSMPVGTKRWYASGINSEASQALTLTIITVCLAA
jgi:hypothetical protein